MTVTASFGTSRRESHDASAFYDRFPPMVETKAKLDQLPPALQLAGPQLLCGDARDMAAVPDATVALVVTSPPYYANRDYEQSPGPIAGGGDGSPASYPEYLTMLEDVFAECVRALEPGGRIAVNVANLGRRPYRSLSAEVIGMFERLGLLLRAEHIWIKAEAAAGSCAFGSWRSPSNPAIRDLTERIIVASKGQTGRVGSRQQRRKAGRPAEATITAEQFLAWSYDTWRIRPESATRVGHPAPFPVELPERLIRMHTYGALAGATGEVVLDPFMGAGSTALAAVRTGRQVIGYDLDASYLGIAQLRLDAEAQRPPQAA